MMKFTIDQVGQMLVGKRQQAAMFDVPDISVNVHGPRRISLHDLFFLIFLTVWLAGIIVADTVFSGADAAYKVSTMAFLGIVLNDLLLDTHSRRSMLLMILLAVIGANSHRVGNTAFGMNLLIIFCARHVDFRRLVLVSAGVTALCCVAVVGASHAGLLKDVLVPRGDSVRHSLGFAYATYLPHYYLNIVFGYFLLRKNRYHYWELGLALLVDLLIYRQTDARAPFMLVAIVTVVLLLAKLYSDGGAGYGEKWRSAVAYLAPLSFSIFALAAAAMLLWVPAESGVGTKLNGALSGRLELSQDAYETYPINIMGNEITFSGWSDQGDGYMVSGHQDEDGNFVRTKYTYVDSGYLQTLIVEGVLPFATLLVLLTVATIWLVQKSEYLGACLMVVFAIRAIADPQLAMLNYCCLLFAGCRAIEIPEKTATPKRVLLYVSCAAAPAVAVGISVAALLVNYGIPRNIDGALFPDEQFQAYVRGHVDVNHDGKLSKQEAERITSIAIDDASNINGLGAFPNLRSIRAYGDNLTSVDMSGSKSIFAADFSGAKNLSTVTLPSNSRFFYLDVIGTSVKDLDVSSASALSTLKCSHDVRIQGAPMKNAYLTESFSMSPEEDADTPNGLSVNAEYDSKGRLAKRSITGSKNAEINYSYDENAALKSVDIVGDPAVEGTWNISYGDNGLDMHAEGANGQFVNRLCDENGRERQLDIRSNGFEGTLEATLTYGYDIYGMLSTVAVDAEGSSTVYGVHYNSDGSLREISGTSQTENGLGPSVATDDRIIYTKGYSVATTKIVSGQETAYQYKRTDDMAVATRTIVGGQENATTVGSYQYEEQLPYPIWGSITDYSSGVTDTIAIKVKKANCPRIDSFDVGPAVDLDDLTSPTVETDYWVPKNDSIWLLEHEVKSILRTQDSGFYWNGGRKYYDEPAYSDSNSTYDMILASTLNDVQEQYGTEPQYCYYDIDGDGESELLVSDGNGGIARIYGQLQKQPFLCLEADADEKLQLSGNEFVVATKNETSRVYRYNGLTFDLVHVPGQGSDLTAAYEAVAGLDWR